MLLCALGTQTSNVPAALRPGSLPISSLLTSSPPLLLSLASAPQILVRFGHYYPERLHQVSRCRSRARITCALQGARCYKARQLRHAAERPHAACFQQ